MEPLAVNADGYNHAHAYVRLRAGTLGALVFWVLSRLHIPAPFLVDAGDLPHDAECTPGPAGIAVGTADIR